MTQPLAAPTNSRRRPASADHEVEFYDSTSTLVRSVVEFMRPAFEQGTAVVVAAPANADPIGALLQSQLPAERLLLLDAGTMLDAFMVDGTPSAAKFQAELGPLIQAAARAGGPVRIYGEMVAMLWEDGNVLAAVELEQLWNDLAASHDFALLCGYPTALFHHEGTAEQFQSLCEQHATITVTPDRHVTRLASAAVRACSPDEPVVRWKFPASVTSGARAREQLRELLVIWDLGDLLDEAELLATELVNNAVVHANSDVTVSVSRLPAVLRIEVTDIGPGMLLPSDPGTEATHGRGLMLVNSLSRAWGTAVTEDAKTVWFELPSTVTA